jgi:hypothetical protein
VATSRNFQSALTVAARIFPRKLVQRQQTIVANLEGNKVGSFVLRLNEEIEVSKGKNVVKPGVIFGAFFQHPKDSSDLLMAISKPVEVRQGNWTLAAGSYDASSEVCGVKASRRKRAIGSAWTCNRAVRVEALTLNASPCRETHHSSNHPRPPLRSAARQTGRTRSTCGYSSTAASEMFASMTGN